VDVTAVKISSLIGDSVTLAIMDDGCTLPDADDYPCKTEDVDVLIGKILDMETGHLVSNNVTSHNRLGVSNRNFQRFIEVDLNNGMTHGLYLGTAPRIGSMHVRVDGEDEVYLVSGISDDDAWAEVLPWVDPELFKVDLPAVVGVSVVNSKGSFALTRHDSIDWSLAGEANVGLENSLANAMAFRVASLSLREPLGLSNKVEYGLEDPIARVEFDVRSDDGNIDKHSLVIGSQIGEFGEYAVKASLSPYYLTMGAYSVKDFLEKGRDDFVLPAD
jgi:hypothetical protein